MNIYCFLTGSIKRSALFDVNDSDKNVKWLWIFMLHPSFFFALRNIFHVNIITRIRTSALESL